MLEIAEAMKTSFSWDLCLFYKRKSISNFDKAHFPYFIYFKKLDLQFQKSAPIYRLFQLKFIANEANELRSENYNAAQCRQKLSNSA